MQGVYITWTCYPDDLVLWNDSSTLKGHNFILQKQKNDSCVFVGFRNAGSDQNISGKETKSKKHPYYTVLMDGRDSPHIVSMVRQFAEYNIG